MAISVRLPHRVEQKLADGRYAHFVD